MCGMKLISWNLLHHDGANLADVAELIDRERPDLLLLQEATRQFEGLVRLVGGAFARAPLPGRVHGPAMWLAHAPAAPPLVLALPDGAFVRRVCQTVDLGPFTVANVHLSHGQLLNRRQLRFIARRLPPCAAVIGDFNLVGPTLLPGFHDVGPRQHTHDVNGLLRLRLDRCLARGLACSDAKVLPRGASDHHPIMLRLSALSKIRQQEARAGVA
jgi:endonuclease/exonuclease/phosphatase family metal-dependent hydrolase